MAAVRSPAALLVAVALVSGACTSDRDASRDDARPTPAVNATAADLLPTDVAALPEFDAARFATLLDQLEGTPVLVNVWGSWCGPCRTEAPDLARAHAEFGHDVQFLGVDILDSRASARAFIEEFAWRYPSVYDAPGAIRDDLGVLGQPATLLYDRAGELIELWSGRVPPDELQAALRAITT
jgi:thiol-disulfide isomerase/thioredoxin